MNSSIHATTIICVRKNGKVAIASDGQVTLGDTVIKHGAKKIRRLYNEKILAGFAGSSADSFALFSRFESKLEQFHGNLSRGAVELAKDWRTDRTLRHLEAVMIVADDKNTFLISGTGDLIEPDDGIVGIGSGGAFALAAARALNKYTDLTPREIVRELDKYVIGQAGAKRAVAIALRNRIRRQKLPPEMAEEVMPKNIIMIGPTGVGKTEIARRLAKLANSPFLKVEASKFTEVGYVGRDVESIIRDLVEISIDMVREEKLEEVAEKAEHQAEERLLDLLLPSPAASAPSGRPPRRSHG